MPRPRTLLFLSALLFVHAGAVGLTPGLADGGANHQKRNTNFGVSGGNVNDVSRAFCCSGTLGALVSDGSTQYILSNNHVLARGDKAVAGEDISQPGLIDNSCRLPPIVADFTLAPPLGSNVDAAIAELRPGTMDSTGFIEDVGVPSGTIRAATVGLGVAKSGRTTGFTTGTVGTINTSVTIQYQENCATGRKFFVSYTGQVIINSSTFSAGGDSGSLIMTNDSAHSPVALLYAGSSSTTIANPIGEVLDKLSQALGRSVSFGGGGGGNGGGGGGGGPRGGASSSAVRPYIPAFGGAMRELPQQAVENASAALERSRADLMSRPAVIGAGVGASEEDDQEAAIVIYVDRTAGFRPLLPESVEGVRVRVVLTDPFVAF
jgi:hypothetical protein